MLVTLLIAAFASSGEAKAPADDNEPIVYQELSYPALEGSLFPGDNGQCVNYAKAISGLSYSGNAIDWARYVDSSTPSLSAVVVFDRSLSPLGHLAVVIGIDDTKIRITERNYQGLWVVSERLIDSNDPSIVGFITYQPK